MSRFQSCTDIDITSNIINTTSIVYCELNLLSNVETTLEQRCNFYIMASTLLQRCVLVAQSIGSNLTNTLSQRRVFGR